MITTLTTGGAERQLQQLVAASRHEARVVCLYEEGIVADAIRVAGRDVSLLGMAGWRKALAVPRLAMLLRQQRPDVVHVHLLAAQLWGIPAARLAGVPVVISSEHSLMDDTIEGRPHTAWLRALYRLLARGATRTVAVSETTANRLEAWGVPRESVVVVDNGVDIAALDPALPERQAARERLRSAWGVDQNTHVIGSVGRLDPVKRVDDVLRACADELRSGALLVVVGTGPLRRGLEEVAAALGVSERVLFLGARADVPDVLAACDAAVSASRDETFGMAVVEAVASGLPTAYVQCPALEALDSPVPGAFPADQSDGDHVAALQRALRAALDVVDALRASSGEITGTGRLTPPLQLSERYGTASRARLLDDLVSDLVEVSASARRRRRAV